ncbi:MAG: GNAT family N-acetyltransferase [Bacillota bacterium]
MNLRPIRESDLGKMMEWDNDHEIVKYLGKKFLSWDTCVTWFNRVSVNRTHRALAIESETGRLIGTIELEHIEWRTGRGELSICIGERDCWGRGYGSDAVHAFVDFAFHRLHLDQVYLRVYRGNARAIRCYEKVGFRKEGLLRWNGRRAELDDDLILMSLRREDFGTLDRRREAM